MSKLALNIAILPPDYICEAAQAVSRLLWENSQEGFVLDESHLPHITIMQLFVNVKKLESVVRVAQKSWASRLPIEARILGVNSFRSCLGMRFAEWTLDLSPGIRALHAGLRVDLGKVRAPAGNAMGFFGNLDGQLADSHIRYVEQFSRIAGGRAFRPHITLGAGATSMEPPVADFRVDRLAVCQLGEYWTCRRLIYEAHR
jgi:2'-5' RNA ligase